MIELRDRVRIQDFTINESVRTIIPLFDPQRDIRPEIKNALFAETKREDNVMAFLTKAGPLAYMYPDKFVTAQWKSRIVNYVNQQEKDYAVGSAGFNHALPTFLFSKKLVPSIKLDKDVYTETENILLDVVPEEYHHVMYWAQFVFPQLRELYPPRTEDIEQIRKLLNKSRDKKNIGRLSEAVAKAKTLAPELLKEQPLTVEELDRMKFDMTYSRHATFYDHMFNLHVLSAKSIIYHTEGPEFIMEQKSASLPSERTMPIVRRF